MSSAENLLNTLSSTGQLATSFGEAHIVIDDKRIITVPDKLKRLAVQYDHDIETVTFDCPRYWDGIDMSEMSIYINYLRSDTYTGTYKAQNVVVDSSNSTKMHFDWTISRIVSSVVGKLVFLVCIKKADENGNEVNHWNSELCKDCYVSEGLEVDGEELKELYPDIIDQWYDEVLGVINEVETVKNGLIEMRDSGALDGATFTPSVSETCDLSWTNDRGRENPETVNIKGDPGVSPIITVTDIQGGHRVTITDINGTNSFDVLDTIIDATDAASEILNNFVYVGSVEPTTYPVLWFDTNSPWGTGAAIKFIDTSGVTHEIDPVVLRENVSDIEEILNHITNTDNPHNVTAVQVGALSSAPITATGDGTAYTATVEGINTLTAGASFIMVPDTTSTSQAVTLNVNNLGAKNLRRRVSAGSSVTTSGYSEDWLAAGKPVRVMYDGLFWTVDIVQAHASDLMGSVPIASGGTGATNASDALTNLGAAATSHTHSASDITSGTLGSGRLPTVPISKGGTGATTAAAALTNLGALAASRITAVYNVAVSFTSGVATYTNSAITTSSVVLVERRVGTAGSNNVQAFGTTSNSGSVTIVMSAESTASINMNILIINP